MLSKVLTGADARQFHAAAFPELSGSPERPRESAGDHPSGDDSADVQLRERFERAEAERAGERRDAFEQGRQRGEQQARAELQPVLEKLGAALSDLADLRPGLRRRAERDVVQLSLLIAKRVLHREISVDSEALSAMARVAFERLVRAESFRVRIHPRFAAAIRAVIPPVQAARVVIEPDESCAPGTLVIHSSEGTVDASIDTQLEEISRGLTDRLAHA